jgi:hypothetical protein
VTLTQFSAARAPDIVVLICFEIRCGLLILTVPLTWLATLPMIVDMIGALTITNARMNRDRAAAVVT